MKNYFDTHDRGGLAHDLILIEDTTYTGPGKRYHSNGLDILRDVTAPSVGIDFLLGKKD